MSHGRTLISVQLALREGDPLRDLIESMMQPGESTTPAVKRVMHRYRQLIQYTSPPPHELLRVVAPILIAANYKVTIEYPDKDTIIELINSSDSEPELRVYVVDAIMEMRYAVYARFIEALDGMIRGIGGAL